MDLNDDLPAVSRFTWALAKYFPRLHQFIMHKLGESLKQNPGKLLVTFKKQFPPADYAILEQTNRLKPFCETTIEAMSEGAKGAAYDVQLYAREWDFSLDEIQMPLTLFHGEQDRNVPIAPVRQVVANLPTAKLITYPDEGHISLILNQFEAIAKVLVGD
jgi:pimeloyl-ACP methyl ester carboxylesterase